MALVLAHNFVDSSVSNALLLEIYNSPLEFILFVYHDAMSFYHLVLFQLRIARA